MSNSGNIYDATYKFKWHYHDYYRKHNYYGYKYKHDKERADPITIAAFVSKTRNVSIQPETFEERIDWLIKNGTLINKPFNGHACHCLIKNFQVWNIPKILQENVYTIKVT